MGVGDKYGGVQWRGGAAHHALALCWGQSMDMEYKEEQE